MFNLFTRSILSGPLYRTCLLAGLLLTGLWTGTPALAQGNTASLNGVIHDSSGAAVPDAVITLTNKSTGDLRRTRSNHSGVFDFAALQSGDFDLLIEKPSFEKVETPSIHLDPGDVRALPEVKLVPGSVSETVTVNVTQAGVSTDSGEVSSTISSNDIENLAVEGRDVTELLKILPGMALSNGAQYTVSDNRAVDPGTVSIGGGLGGYVANGTLKNGTALLIDGADITDAGNYGVALQTVNYDMVAEVKVSTGSFGADTARGPVVINAISKSGTDRFHGSLYTYARAYPLNSIDYLVKAYGQAKPADRQIYPGFTIAGPVRLPFTTWNRDSKLTFFVGAEEYAQRNGYAYNNVNYALVRALVPTANMRLGQFNQSEIKAYLGDQYVTSTVNGVTTCGGNYPMLCPVPTVAPNGTPVVNGDISAYLDPLSKDIFNLFPLPNQASTGGFNYIAGNYVNNDLWQTRIRTDYGLSDREKLFLSYGLEEGVSYPTQGSGIFSSGSLGGLPYPGGGQIQNAHSHVLSLGFNSVLSNSLTNEFYAGAAYLGQPTHVRRPDLIQGNPYQFLFPNPSNILPALTDSGHNGLPELPIQDSYYGPTFSNRQVRSAGDNVTKLYKTHVFRTGIFYQWDDNPQYSSGFYTNGAFSPSITNATFTDPIATNGSGPSANLIHTTGTGGASATTGNNYLADFSEGIINSFTQANEQVEANLYFWNLSGYMQDHWRATSRLSVDAGLRFEHFTPWQDVSGLGIAVFSASAYAANFPTQSPGIVYHGISPSIPNSGVPTETVYVEPRGGFSLDVYGTGKTVLRGGAGLYRQHDSYGDLSNAASAARGQRTFTSSGSGGLQFSTIHQYQTNAAANAFTKDTSVHVVDATDTKVPTVLTYNAAIDQFFPHGNFIEIAYVGNQSSNLLNNQQSSILANINAIPLGGIYQPYPGTRPDITTGPAPGYLFPFFTGSGATSMTPSAQNITTAEVDAYRPYPLYAQIYAQKHVLIANYNALQARYRVQGKVGGLAANYTWGKVLSNYWGTDPINYANGYMPALTDRRQILSINGNIHVGNPVQNRFVGAFTNGWAVASIVTFQTGVFLPTIYSYNYSATNALSLVVPQGTTATVNGRTSACVSTTCSVGPTTQKLLGSPDYMFLLRYTGNPRGTKKYQYINPNVLELPGLLQSGPFKVPATWGPAFFNADINASKTFLIHENQSVRFRVAAFNFLNRANPSFSSLNPANYQMNYTYTSPTPGDLNQILTIPRNTQSQFGSTLLANGTPQKEGRRVLEVSVKYAF